MPLSALTRRRFLCSTGLLSAAWALSPRLLAQSRGANEKIVLGLIGCGGMGRSNLRSFMALDGVEVAGLCDVDETHLDEATADVVGAERPAPKRWKDFRHLLDQKDIDAVIIATPDHWHALPFIAACEAGKDIYCEKPIAHNLVECRAMLNAARHFRRVVQVGTWQRSVPHFQQAIEFVRSGQLGDISVCRTWYARGVDPKAWLGPMAPQPDQAPPAGFDYDFWLGPAPKRPYNPNRAHFSWRWFFDYGGGLMTDWGMHLIDIVLLAMQASDPVSVSAAGHFIFDDSRDTPDTMQALYRFPKWNLIWENRLNNGRGLDGGRQHGCEFIGANGSLIVDRTTYQWFPEKPGNPGPPPPAKGENTHWQNFLDCMKTRGKPRSDIESMAKTNIVCNLGNIAFQSGTTIRWDAGKQELVNRRDARGCRSYQRDYRAPWKLKIHPA